LVEAALPNDLVEVLERLRAEKSDSMNPGVC
jgi:hypothetical protein